MRGHGSVVFIGRSLEMATMWKTTKGRRKRIVPIIELLQPTLARLIVGGRLTRVWSAVLVEVS